MVTFKISQWGISYLFIFSSIALYADNGNPFSSSSNQMINHPSAYPTNDSSAYNLSTNKESNNQNYSTSNPNRRREPLTPNQRSDYRITVQETSHPVYYSVNSAFERREDNQLSQRVEEDTANHYGTSDQDDDESDQDDNEPEENTAD